MQAALPDKAPAAPARPRKVLVWGHLWTHEPNVMAARTFEAMGKKTGAFEAVISEESKDLLPERLKDFDAVLMNNTHEQEPFLPAPAELKSLGCNRPPAQAAMPSGQGTGSRKWACGYSRLVS